MRDEVGLVRAISVKERSSSQRKEWFKKIQLAAGVTRDCIRTLVVDMKVRWSSTYMMLNRAYSLRNVSMIYSDVDIPKLMTIVCLVH